MIKKLFLVVFLTSLTINAQDTLRVKMNPTEGFDRLLLYQIIGSKRQYVSFSTIENDTYKLLIPKGKKSGIYRIFFDINNNGYFDVLYNNKPISVTFNPNSPDETAIFDTSEDNKIYYSYINSIAHQQAKVDSIQIDYFSDNTNKNLEKSYIKNLKKISALQNHFEKKSEGLLANEFIKTNKKHFSSKIIAEPKDYLEFLTTHFFDAIDFGNQSLINSSHFIDKSIEYVFYLNDSDDIKTHTALRKKSVKEVMEKIGDNNNNVKSDILTSLLYVFADQEEITLVEYIKENYYEKLPSEYINTEFLKEIEGMLKTAIGRTSPEITWLKGNKIERLSTLDSAENYIITFWSTTCSHCLNDIPKLYEYTKNRTDVKVIAIALEDDKYGFEYHTRDLNNWIHVLALNRWENKIAKDYDIHSTPSFFILDKNKTIIFKPENLVDVTGFFDEK